jgi:hypothetical protein
MAPLPKLPPAYGRPCFRLRRIQARRLCPDRRRDNQIQFVSRQIARTLRKVRIDHDVRTRKPTGNSIPYRHIHI